MLALRLTRGARTAVQLRRLLVAAASAGTGFLLLCALGHAMSHPADPTASLLRLAWCTPPLAATVYFSTAVARTDPATTPRPGLSAVGLGPARLMLVSATTTALATTLGSTVALLLFLYLRGDLTGLPFDGTGADYLAAARPLPVPGTLTLLAIVPTTATAATAWVLRPRTADAARPRHGATDADASPPGRWSAGVRPARAAWVSSPPAPDHPPAPTPAADKANPLAALPWGIATLAAGLAVETYASRAEDPTPVPLPGGLAASPTGLLTGWILTAVGLALTGPGLTHLTGRLLQSARPGALRLLAGRVLMAEAPRIGRPLGLVCAVASAAYATTALHDSSAPSLGPLTTLGALVVAGCTVATLLTAAVETKQARTDTTAALLRLGAPATVLRSAAALRATALLAVFAPLTLLVAELATRPLSA
ncbi:hypothetical protein [Streptomyces sp. NPDC057877]|uniref:hypothetical protein n=1 Tax=Streptomyces sp. NPDC057877 TaxID=3346269 RepID=UPI0036990EF0